jgi:hypothetical protein
MIEPIKTAKKLQKELEAINSNLRLSSSAREEYISSSIKQLSEIVAKLTKLDKIIPLTLNESSKKVSKIRDFINGLTERVIDFSLEKYKTIITNSPSLNTLQSCGLRFESFTKFTNLEFKAAEIIGDNFGVIETTMSQIRTSYKEEKYITFTFFNFDCMFDLLKILAENNCIEITKSCTKKKNENYIDCDFRALQGLIDRNTIIKIYFNIINNDNLDRFFLLGIWFNVYTHKVLDDHLSVNGQSFELFDKVVYYSARDVVTLRGDFDIFGEVDEKILLIECKSGKLRRELKKGDHKFIDEIDYLKNKVDGLKKVLSGCNKEYIFILVYNPFISENNSIVKEIDPSIKAIPINQIRSNLLKIFKKN